MNEQTADGIYLTFPFLPQVMRPEDRDILRECDIDVVLCLDEFRTTLQSRNSVCFGMTALIENMFTTSSLPKEVDCKFVLG
jgi:hypothetical protein